MAIGNQLDLNIVVNGFNQAQSALDRLSGVFGNLGQNAINVTSTFRNLEQSLERSREDIRSVANTTNQATKSISDFGESLTAVEGYLTVIKSPENIKSTSELMPAFLISLETFFA